MLSNSHFKMAEITCQGFEKYPLKSQETSIHGTFISCKVYNLLQLVYSLCLKRILIEKPFLIENYSFSLFTLKKMPTFFFVMIFIRFNTFLWFPHFSLNLCNIFSEQIKHSVFLKQDTVTVLAITQIKRTTYEASHELLSKIFTLDFKSQSKYFSESFL